MEIINKIDFFILDFIQDNLTSDFLDIIMPKVTLLGELGAIWIILSVVLIITKKYRKYGIFMLVGMLIGVIVGNLLLKNLVARERPFSGSQITLLISPPSDYSFPSGHTLSSVIGASVMIAANRKFGFFAIPLAVLIAFSRLYLYVHFPTDVLFAALLGIIISIFTVIFGNYLLKKKEVKIL